MLWISPDRVGSAAGASEGEQLPQPRRSYLFPGICPQQGAGTHRQSSLVGERPTPPTLEVLTECAN